MNMSEKELQHQVRCPQGHTDGISLRGVQNLWNHTFETGRGGPATSDLRGKILTYWCDECQEAFMVEKR
jgi:hypothetical protein